MSKKIKISLVIVHYKNEGDLFDLLNSFYKYKPKVSFEIIVVDNSENKKLLPKLKKYKEIKYLNPHKNLGYGSGINFGVKNAIGEYIFVLNPDVVFSKDIILPILKRFNSLKNIGVIAPLLYTLDGKIMQQGAKDLSEVSTIVKFSFLDKLLPNNPISKNYWVNKWTSSKLKQVDNVPGTAFVIKKEVFNQIGGFDEKFFLYFEEFDLCDRLRKLKYKLYIDPTQKLTHKWGTSTKLLENKDEIFLKSRKYYLIKKFGFIKAFGINLFLSLNLTSLIFAAALIIAALVRFYNLNEIMSQGLGDQGWFYLSARDLLLTHTIPLVGITSSHTWLHQGPIWTYLVSFAFLVSKFNPISPGILSIVLDLITLTSIYLLTSKMFNLKTALFASMLYAFSPYVIIASRMPYHTNPIILLTLLFIFSMHKWIKGSMLYFPLTLLCITFLYNFELQTVILIPIILLFLLYGFIKKALWVKNLFTKKIIVLSLLSLIVPMLPVILYDLKHGFPQTIIFAGWIFYKIFKSFQGGESLLNITSLIRYFEDFIGKLYFVFIREMSAMFFIISFIYLFLTNMWGFITKTVKLNCLLLFILLIFTLLGIFVNKTPSDAYLYSLIIPFILIFAILLAKISFQEIIFYCVLFLISLLLLLNVLFTINTGYYKHLTSYNGYFNKVESAKYVARSSKGRHIRVIVKGEGSQFASFGDYYKYLIWYYGGNIDQNSKLIYILYETPYGTRIIKGPTNVKRSNFN